MAHSFVTAHDNEEVAFEAFARSHPDNVVLLIDTYDTLRGARTVVDLVPGLLKSGIKVRAVRIDSGDLADLSREVRSILDRGDAADVQIFASGGLNEYALQDLLAAGAPVDGFGIGTDLDVSSDAPYLDCAYKLQEYDGRICRKRSAGKETWPGRKQVFRRAAADGTLVRDFVGLETEKLTDNPLMIPVMRKGRRLHEPEPLATIRNRAAASLATLPKNLRALDRAEPYAIDISAEVQALADEFDRQLAL